MKTIVCIGDSLVEGEGDASGLDGWVGRLRHKWQGDHRVFNLGLGGDTIRDIGYRLGEMLVRGPHIVILGCATNDVSIYREPAGEQPKLSDSHRLRYWPLVVEKIKSICPHLLVTPGMYLEKDYIGEDGGGLRQTNFNDHVAFIGRTAAQHGVEFLPLDAGFGKTELRAHGVHWNSAGYDKLSDLIFNKLTNLGWLMDTQP
jgi:lysophospholipase L1-like esterase